MSPSKLTMQSNVPGIITGLSGTTLLALAACSNAFSEDESGWPWRPVRDLGASLHPFVVIAFLGVGIVGLFLGWWLLRPVAERPDAYTGRVLALWSLPLLIAPPLLSPDAFLYADLGWILHQGGNPYQLGVGSLNGPYLAQVDEVWIGHGVAYPPLALRVSQLAVLAFGLDPYWGMIGQRAVALVGVALIATCLPRLARRVGVSPRWARWFGVLNPLVVMEFVGGAHNDSLMVGLVVAGLLLSTFAVRAFSSGLVLAQIVIGLAMAVKPQAGLAVVAAAGLPVVARLAALPWPGRLRLLGWRSLLGACVAVAVFSVVSLGSGLGFGWTRWLGVMSRAENLWIIVLGPSGILPWLSIAGRVVAIAGVAWLVLRHPEKPLQIVAVGSALVTLLSPVWHPWYLVLSLVLFGCLAVPPTLARGLRIDPAVSQLTSPALEGTRPRRPQGGEAAGAKMAGRPVSPPTPLHIGGVHLPGR